MVQAAAGIRAPAVAGTFYPAAAEPLSGQVDQYLRAAVSEHAVPKAIIAPHAGYVYSGPIAGTAYAALAPARDVIRRVVLLGPSHRVAFRGLAASSATAYSTPLGDVPLDRVALDAALKLAQVHVRDEAHAEEHGLEVHLPFLQCVLGSFALVPLVVGHASPEEVDQVLDLLWGGPETLIVISSDLSHYHQYGAARRLDAAASRAIETLRGDELSDQQACGHQPLRGLLSRARKLDLRATTLDLRNSGDTAGGHDRVVGYGAYVLEDAAAARLAERQRHSLLEAAKTAIRYQTARGKTPKVNEIKFPRQLQAQRATFVTVKLDGKLRGCIGSTAPRQALITDVISSACKAVAADPRFPPVTEEEVPRLEVSVSILSTPRQVAFASEDELVAQLRPKADGLILLEGKKRGLFLPQVWDSLPDPRQFVRNLKVKAGLKPDYWSAKVKVFRFTTESF